MQDLVWYEVEPLLVSDAVTAWAATTEGALRCVTRPGAEPEYYLHRWLADAAPWSPWWGCPRGVSCWRRGNRIPEAEALELEPQPHESQEDQEASLREQVVPAAPAVTSRLVTSQGRPPRTTWRPWHVWTIGCLFTLAAAMFAIVVLALRHEAAQPPDPAVLERERLVQEEHEAEFEELRAAEETLAVERTEQLRAGLEPFAELVDVARSRWLGAGAAVIHVRADWHDLAKSDRVLIAQGFDGLVNRISGGEGPVWDLRDPLGKRVAGSGLFGGLSAD